MRPRMTAIEPRWILVTIFFFAGAFLGGLSLYLWVNVSDENIQKIHPANSKFKYINPLIAVDTTGSKQFSQNKALELKLGGLIKDGTKSGAITSAAIYFRDIEPGIWVSINGDDNLFPGKLLKIPIMIAYYKLAEANPAILDQTIVFNGDQFPKEDLFDTTDFLKVGQAYTVEELIEDMIVNADDSASNLLFDNIEKDSLNEVFSDLGIQFKEDKFTQDVIPLKLYTLFFRVLYNSTYLNREFSEKAIEVLMKADNALGLGAGLPKDVKIASRLGARNLEENGQKVVQMYECGLIYYPHHPYLICGLLKGESLEVLRKTMKLLSEVTYKEMDFKYHE